MESVEVDWPARRGPKSVVARALPVSAVAVAPIGIGYEVTIKTQGEIEAAVCDGMIRFEQEQICLIGAIAALE